ncbi:hypothetical protein [Amycolatopsis vancoresmycina]|uniref:Uncharacterized protein n=1 Tax=Amycolatopsis vancoresmycina DSM 44592 TaxID=1292037 RepID=R1G5Z8_9PSEU|nr:hypothetical protein [Amycolatopsis vancoresmycina]EOD66882.1 hypothetical protein H480_19203 [Amycolatopsis vancoresmycina DSM 44592]
MPDTKPRRTAANRDFELLDAARRGQLTCTRDHDLNPTYRGPFPITEPDRAAIMRLVLRGALRYEQAGSHGFGVGRLLPRGAR